MGKPPESFCHLDEVRCQLVIAVLVQLTKICFVARQRLRKEQAAATFEGGNSPGAVAASAPVVSDPIPRAPPSNRPMSLAPSASLLGLSRARLSRHDGMSRSRALPSGSEA